MYRQGEVPLEHRETKQCISFRSPEWEGVNKASLKTLSQLTKIHLLFKWQNPHHYQVFVSNLLVLKLVPLSSLVRYPLCSVSHTSVRSFSGTASATADMSMCYRMTCYIFTTHLCKAPMIASFPEATQSSGDFTLELLRAWFLPAWFPMKSLSGEYTQFISVGDLMPVIASSSFPGEKVWDEGDPERNNHYVWFFPQIYPCSIFPSEWVHPQPYKMSVPSRFCHTLYICMTVSLASVFHK